MWRWDGTASRAATALESQAGNHCFNSSCLGSGLPESRDRALCERKNQKAENPNARFAERGLISENPTSETASRPAQQQDSPEQCPETQTGGDSPHAKSHAGHASQGLPKPRHPVREPRAKRSHLGYRVNHHGATRERFKFVHETYSLNLCFALTNASKASTIFRTN